MWGWAVYLAEAAVLVLVSRLVVSVAFVLVFFVVCSRTSVGGCEAEILHPSYNTLIK